MGTGSRKLVRTLDAAVKRGDPESELEYHRQTLVEHTRRLKQLLGLSPDCPIDELREAEKEMLRKG
jgi:hypothetical protein